MYCLKSYKIITLSFIIACFQKNYITFPYTCVMFSFWKRLGLLKGQHKYDLCQAFSLDQFSCQFDVRLGKSSAHVLSGSVPCWTVSALELCLISIDKVFLGLAIAVVVQAENEAYIQRHTLNQFSALMRIPNVAQVWHFQSLTPLQSLKPLNVHRAYGHVCIYITFCFTLLI